MINLPQLIMNPEWLSKIGNLSHCVKGEVPVNPHELPPSGEQGDAPPPIHEISTTGSVFDFNNIMHLTPDQQLAEVLSLCYDDPLLYVLIMFPWGESGSPLSRYPCPDLWQREFLVELGEVIRQRNFDGFRAVDPIQFSTASGHGIGKSTMCAWLVKFLLDTRPGCRITITSNTMQQLKARTWSQVNYWNSLSLTSHWWRITSGQTMSMYHRYYQQTWRADAVPAVAEKSDAFAGQHNAHGTSAYIFDEASGIPEKIFEVRTGGLTDGEPFTFDFGNPVRFSGSFYENMLGKNRHRYIRRFIDSRESAITNKHYLSQLARDHGEDSDYYRTRVRGLFPHASASQLIPTSWVERCIDEVELYNLPEDIVVFGVDVARFGDDDSVICIRHGNNCRNLTTLAYFRSLEAVPQPFTMFRSIDLMELASRVAHLANQIRPDAIFVDAGGMGGGVVDRLSQLGFDPIEVEGSAKPNDTYKYANLRANCWGNLQQAIKRGIALPCAPERGVYVHNIRRPSDEYYEDVAHRLKSELVGVEYTYNKADRVILEDKESIKSRLGRSPDVADALALTYAYPVYPTRGEFLYRDAGQSYHHSYDFSTYERL